MKADDNLSPTIGLRGKALIDECHWIHWGPSADVPGAALSAVVVLDWYLAGIKSATDFEAPLNEACTRPQLVQGAFTALAFVYPALARER